jgi:hypothetical protein
MKYNGLIRSLLVGGALVAGGALAAGPAAANVQTFTAAAGNLAAEATFTTSAGELVITLKNDLTAAQIISSAQAISDLSFTTSTAPGASTGTDTATGPLGNFDFTTKAVTLTGNTNLTRWASSTAPTGSDFHLTTLTGGQPSQLILPSATSLPNANMGVDNFNPYVFGTATFTIFRAGINANTTISNVAFSFGTQPETIIGVPGPIVGAGLPGLMMACLGLVGLARRRRQKFA